MLWVRVLQEAKGLVAERLIALVLKTKGLKARGFKSHLAQKKLASLMVECVAVNHRDEGSIPSQAVFFFR